jgi:hypothetical protein
MAVGRTSDSSSTRQGLVSYTTRQTSAALCCFLLCKLCPLLPERCSAPVLPLLRDSLVAFALRAYQHDHVMPAVWLRWCGWRPWSRVAL